jgi:hypothetical protein
MRYRGVVCVQIKEALAIRHPSSKYVPVSLQVLSNTVAISRLSLKQGTLQVGIYRIQLENAISSPSGRTWKLAFSSSTK